MKKFLALTSVLALSLAACSPATDTGEGPIKIGFIGPLTGEAAPYGVDSFNGSKLKMDEINAKGGINGRMIELVAEDGRCNGTDASSAAQKLINVDQVVAILGGQCSGETLAVAPIAEAAKVVIISAISSSPDVTSAGDFVFRDYPSDALKTKAMAKYFKDRGLSKVAIIAENTDFAVGFRDALKKDLGTDFVFAETVEPGTKDYRSLVTRLKNVDFDVFVADGQFPASIAAMLQQLREQGIETLAIAHDVGQTEETLKLAKDAAEGFQSINIPAMAQTSPFGQKYFEQFGAPQGAYAYAAHGYDAMGVLAQAISEVGTDGEVLRDYLYQLPSYKGVIGTFSFDENGDVIGVSYKLFEVQDGTWVELADAPAV